MLPRKAGAFELLSRALSLTSPSPRSLNQTEETYKYHGDTKSESDTTCPIEATRSQALQIGWQIGPEIEKAASSSSHKYQAQNSAQRKENRLLITVIPPTQPVKPTP